MYREFVLISFCYFAVTVRGNPIIQIDSFEDTWDYKIPPQNEPVLLESGQHHTLPTYSIRETLPKQEILEGTNVMNITIVRIGDILNTRISCPVCKLGVLILQNEVKQGASYDDTKARFVSLCVDFNVEVESVCSGIFDAFAPHLLPALNVTQIGASQICSLCLGEICGNISNPLHDWDIEVPEITKPLFEEESDYVEGASTFKVLQLTDTHFDPNYLEGSPANCEEPICCHAYSTPNETGILEPAGKWGSYSKCDVPGVLVNNMLKHIAENHKDIDYIIWTGDLPPHDIWNQTKEGNLEILRETVKQMEEAFPNTPIFPSLGNHEGVPSGSFPPPWLKDEDLSNAWIYDELSKQWSKWLPSSINATVSHGAFYSILIRPGFRLISLNMNYCITTNWWLIINSTDPAQELKWLIHELQEAENNDEKVHIIGHIPPGDPDCIKVWSKNYYHIIDRYQNTIAAQFFGHRHSDEFQVFYDAQEYKKPVAIAYVAPSITTFEHHNPGYRIYYVDGDHNQTTREVLDHETWVADLKKANDENSEPEWYKLYTAREAYGLKTLKPTDWSNLIDTLADDDELFDLFYRFYYKDSNVRPDCDDIKCKLQILCDLRCGRSHYRHYLCSDLEHRIQS